jgi:uncharacterized membrane protein
MGNIDMTLPTRALVFFVVIFHMAIFCVEVFFWMSPAVHEIALRRLAIQTALGMQEQALVLRATFVNLGFYNLLVACAGAIGLVLMARGNARAGHALTAYMCVFALGAGIVLLFSTHAYIGALLQAAPAAAALGLMLRARSLDATERV